MKDNKNTNEKTGLLVDEPISSPEQDRLNRIQFSEHLADVLFKHEDSNCLVAALNGEWGCGKSSVLNLIERRLVEKRNKNEDIIVLRFNPWNATDVEQLTAMFFRELKMSIVGVDKDKQAKENIGKLLDIFSGILAVGQLSPVGNQYFSMGSALTRKASGMLKDTPKRTQEEIKKQLDDMLKGYTKRIFIIIDDIDRLDIDAMKLLFRLIRLNANFKNTTYLLAFDRNLVGDVLQVEQPGHGKEYVDKIVQVPINVPSPDEGLLNDILLNELYVLAKKWGEFDEERWKELYLEGRFSKYFNNMRNVVRYVNGLKITYPLVSAEVDMVDFMGLNLIRTFAPLSYEMIRKNKDVLTTGGADAFESPKTKEVAKEIIDRIYNFPKSTPGREQEYEKEKDLANLVKSTCKVLFPKISSIEETFSYGGGWENEWRQKKRICSIDYFEKYFMLGTPVHDISDVEMSLFVAMTEDAGRFYEKFVEFFDRGMGRRMLEKMEDYVVLIDKASIESVIIAIFNAEDKIVAERRQMMTMDSSTLAARIVYLLLERIQEKERRKEILINAIQKCQRVYLPVDFVSLITPREEEGVQERKEMLGFSPSDLSEIQKKCLNKIKLFIAEKKLSKAPVLGGILYRWREWENEEEVKKYVADLISTEEGLWDFLIGFTNEVLSTAGDYKIISPKSVNDFADFDSIDKRIQDIVVKQEKELADKQKEVVEALKNGKRRDLP
jgi:predicted KAP-like P-loop ATPase